jgi:hypothetical protein
MSASTQRVSLAQRRVEPNRAAHQRLQLGDQLGAGVPGADHHEAQPRRTLVGIVGGVRQLELLQHVVTQVDGLGQRLEADRVLGEARDGEHAADRAERHHQAVPADRALRPAGGHVGAGAAVEVHGGDVAHPHARASQRLPQRHHHVTRLDRAGRRLRQQRRVQHVVLGVDQHDLGLVLGQPPLQAPGGVHAAEPAAEHQDPFG